jgi:parallel beta-helix repeat protein
VRGRIGTRFLHINRRARLIVVVASVVALSAGATAAVGLTVNTVPATPPEPLGWSVNGAAQTVPSGFQLTHAGRHDEAGTAFWETAVDLTTPLAIAFDATLTGGGAVGADGMTLVFADALHGGDPHVAGESASAMGYGGIPGIAVGLDTYRNIGEPSGNFVGIANAIKENGAPNYLSTTTAVPDLRAAVHHFEVDTSRNHLDIAVDGHVVLSRAVTLPERAFVGFTAANGGYTDDHVVTNIRADTASGIGSIGSNDWPFEPASPPPTTVPTPPSPTPPSPTPACVGVPMLNGQADINAAPAGTTFCLSGTHNWDLTPKSGDRFFGPAVLDGGGTTRYAFEPGTATNVVLSQLEVRNYAPGYQMSAIMTNRSSSGWTLQDLQVHDNGNSSGGGAVAVGPGWQILGGRYSDNRQKGLTGAYAMGATIDGAEIDHNNFTDDSYTTATVNCGDDAGGFKWVADDVTVKNSSIHDNACVGLWSDINTHGAVVTNNQVYDNWAEGIFIEISHDATITGNTVYGNGFRSFRGACGKQWLYGGGITIASSDNVTVTGNNVAGNCNGITATQENRPDGDPGLLQNVTVESNTIAGPGGKTGAGVYPVSIANLLLRDIAFANNTITGGMNLCGLAC